MKWWGACGILMGAGAAAGVAASAHLAVRRYRFTSKKLTGPVKLAVLSDLHSTLYGKGQRQLLSLLEAEQPDGIFLPGDMVDDRAKEQGAWTLLEALGGRYPCWYVTGNHEFRIPDVERVLNRIQSCGIHVLAGMAEETILAGQPLCIGGFDALGIEDGRWRRQLARCQAGRTPGCYSILLSHRPNFVTEFSACGYELVVCGHAHGGQWRIPGVLNGLYAPEQGLFPDYAGGLYKLGNCTMVVSRGLARNFLPRIFNPPEVPIITLLPA